MTKDRYYDTPGKQEEVAPKKKKGITTANPAVHANPRHKTSRPRFLPPQRQSPWYKVPWGNRVQNSGPSIDFAIAHDNNHPVLPLGGAAGGMAQSGTPLAAENGRLCADLQVDAIVLARTVPAHVELQIGGTGPG